tara:strand:- start:48 stop:302 length:255 start_codon:yes stop_codon:yes gene_type:complete
MATCVLGQYAPYSDLNQPQNMPEQNLFKAVDDVRELFQDVRVQIDPRVIAEVDRKKPIGVSRTGWVNLLLQRAIALEPEPLARD